MTWTKLDSGSLRLKCAAAFAAYFVCAPSLAAQDVVFRSADNAVAITGRFLAFDGQSVTVLGDRGPVTFRSDDMTCEGQACPDLDDYVPSLRMVGPARMADILMPALIDVYVSDNGWRLRENPGGFAVATTDGRSVLDIAIIVAGPDRAFDSFVAHEADILLSLRSLRQTEKDRAFDAGLGRLDAPQQGQILALDALVPVVAATSDRETISIADLMQNLSAGGGFEVHLPDRPDGQLQGFEDRFLQPAGLSLGVPDVAHSSRAELVAAVAASESGLALVPLGEAGNGKILSLRGPCGLQSDARYLTVKTEDYPLTFPMFVYAPQRQQHAAIADFLDWLRSPAAQLVIRRAGFFDLAATPIPLSDQGDRLANAITSAGVEVPLGELQRMVRLLQPRVRMSSTFRFEPGSTRLDGPSRSNVMQLAQAVRDGQFGGQELMFIGFSDGRGPAGANRDLSAARADAVRRDVQRALGDVIPDNVIFEIDAFGEALPMACDDTVWGQQTNRRVELWVRDAG